MKTFEKSFDPKKLGNWEANTNPTILPKPKLTSTKVIVNENGHLLPGIPRRNTNSWITFFQPPPSKRTLKRDDKLSRNRCTENTVRSPTSDSNRFKVTNDDKESVNENRDKSNNIRERDTNNATFTARKPATNLSIRASSSELSFPTVNGSAKREPILAEAYSHSVVAKNLKQNDQQHNALPDMAPAAEQNRCAAADDELASPIISFKGFGPAGPTRCTKLKVYRPKTAIACKENAGEQFKRAKSCTNKRPIGKPLTEMDLAIYWDVTPTYPECLPAADANNNANTAPALFTTVQHDDYQKDVNSMDIPLNCSTSSNNGSDGNFAHPGHDRPLPTNPSAVMDVIPNANPAKERDDAASDISKLDRRAPSKSCSAVSARLSLSSSSSLSSRPSLKAETSVRKRNDENARQRLSVEGPIGDDKQEPPKEKTVRGDEKFAFKKHPRRYESTPNLSESRRDMNECTTRKKVVSRPEQPRKLLNRPCVACEMRRIPSQSENLDKGGNFKLAFKAGKPNNNANSTEAALEKLQRLKTLRVPKPKMPYCKKSYSIASLIPPFSVWPTVTGQDYPDHWRLASVYQHSYKPLESRRTQLIKTVFL